MIKDETGGLFYPEQIETDKKYISKTLDRISSTKQNIQKCASILVRMRQKRDELKSQGKPLGDIEISIGRAEAVFKTYKAKLEFDKALLQVYEKRIDFMKQHFNYMSMEKIVEEANQIIRTSVQDAKRTAIKTLFRSTESAFSFGLERGGK